MDRSSPLILFLHIPKTGGVTLNHTIERWYRPDRIVAMAGNPPECVRKVSQDVLERAAVVRGHFSFGIHEHIRRPARYFTMLRAPIDKAVSLYYYAKARPTHYLYHLLNDRGVPLRDLVKHKGGWSLCNDQVRRLSGARIASGIADAEPLTTAHLEAAKKNLLSEHVTFGLLDRYDESLLMLSEELALPSPYYRIRNRGSGRPSTSELSDEDIRALREANRLDIELYDLAREEFSRRAQAAPWLASAMNRLQRKNATYAWIYPVMRAWVKGRQIVYGRP